MNKRLFFSALLLLTASARAAFTPGRYEIQNLGGLPIGTLAVSWDKTTYDGQPATRVNWEFVYTTEPFKSTETHEAYVTKSGLMRFRKVVTDDAGTWTSEGHIGGDSMIININDRGRKYATGYVRKDVPASDYDLEMPASPFVGMELKQAKSTSTFSVSEMTAGPARRNVNAIAQLKMGEKFVPAVIINTSFSKTVTTSWFSPKGHVLLKEMWKDRQFLRTGD